MGENIICLNGKKLKLIGRKWLIIDNKSGVDSRSPEILKGDDI